MKFRSLAFRRFGPFDDRALDFADDGRNLHIIYGPNEAGKSTALKGLGYFLFGFPHLTTHNFRFNHTEQRIEATLVGRDGATLTAIRRRANKNSLREADDKTSLPDDCLDVYLGGLDEVQFDMLFGVDHARLVEGGADIARGKGSLGQMLFTAGAGLAGLRRIDERLGERLNELFLRTGKKQTITVALGQLKDERQRLKEQTIAVDEWMAERDQLEAVLARRKEFDDERTCLRQEEERLKAYRAAFPTMEALAKLDDELRELRDAPNLPADFGDLHRKTIEDLQIAQAERDRRRAEADQADAALKEMPVESGVLAEDQAIFDLKEQFGAIRKAEELRRQLIEQKRENEEKVRVARDLRFPPLPRYSGGEGPGVRGLDARVAEGNVRTPAASEQPGCSNLRELEGSARDTVPPHPDPLPPEYRGEREEKFAIDAATQARIRSLADAHAERALAVQSLRDRLAPIDARIADLERPLAEAIEAVDDFALDALDRELLQEGPIEKMLNEAAKKFRADREAAESDLEQLRPRWNGTLKTVAKLNPLPLERLAIYETSLEQLDSEIRGLQTRRDETDVSMRERLSRLVDLERPGHVPDEAELKAARAERDRAVDRLSPTRAPSAAEIEAIRSHVRRCDELSELMHREAARAAEIVRCRAEANTARNANAIAQTGLDDRSRRRTEILTRWAREWRPSGISPGEPREMRAWLEGWSALRERVEKLELAAREVKRLAAAVDSHKAKLRAALGLDDAAKELSLTDLHERLRRRIDDARQQRTARLDRETRLHAARAEKETVERDLAAAAEKLAAWRDEWGQAVAVLDLAADAEPAAARTHLDRLAEVLRAIAAAKDAAEQLAAIDLDRTQFVSRLDALRARFGEAESALHAPEALAAAVDDLVRRATEAKMRQRDRERLDVDRRDALAAVNDAEQSVVECQARLRLLCEQAGFAKVEELPGLIACAERRRDVEIRAAEVRRQIAHFAGSQEIAEFLADAEAARPTLEERLAQIKARQELLDQEIPATAVAAAAAEAQLEKWRQTSSEAADRQQTIESLLAQLREQITEYAAVHLARQTLRLTIDRFRERRRDSLLSLAERYFGILTRGAFRGLDVDESEKGEPILLALRKAPSERVEVTGLSDGTRDQLFLALRLAGIEQHIQAHGPMPVVIDDVLVNFDEDREATTLECLAELSKLTQVLVFTHHAHVVEMAKRVAADAVKCHDLAGGNGRQVAVENGVLF